MKVNVVIETASDGYYSCYTEEEFEDFALFGYGETAKLAKEDMLQSYKEFKAMAAEDGSKIEDLEFVFHYDIKSFFDYFDFLNISKVAQLAGINPALMRRYAAGKAKARETQYKKLYSAIQRIARELSVAVL